jgi:hypothetical protein
LENDLPLLNSSKEFITREYILLQMQRMQSRLENNPLDARANSEWKRWKKMLDDYSIRRRGIPQLDDNCI